MKKRYDLITKGYDIDKIAPKVSELMMIDPSDIWAPGKEPFEGQGPESIMLLGSQGIGYQSFRIIQAMQSFTVGREFIRKTW